MKLAVDALNLRGDERGMGRYVRRVLRDFSARSDIELTLLVRDLANHESVRTIVGGAATVARIESARQRRAYDVVWYPWNALRFRAHAPSLVTINDDFAFRFPAQGLIARRREQQPIRRAIAQATRIATISAWSRDELAMHFALDPATIAVLPLAPDPFFSLGYETSQYHEKFVLAVGSGEVRKNIPFLVDMFARAFPEGDVRLVLVGTLDATSRKRLLRGRLPFTERAGIDDDALRTLYRTASVVAVPSLAEGFGLVAAEAQACGASVLAAHTSALPEAVGDGGVLIDPTFTDAWIDALRVMVREPLVNATIRARAAARWPARERERTTSAVASLLQSLSAAPLRRSRAVSR